MTALQRAILCALPATMLAGASAWAAIPTTSASIGVSARVLPRCSVTDCAVQSVVRYREAADPVFDLAPVAGAQVLTITY